MVALDSRNLVPPFYFVSPFHDCEKLSHTLEIVPLREYNKNRKLLLVQTEEFYGPTYYHSDG